MAEIQTSTNHRTKGSAAHNHIDERENFFVIVAPLELFFQANNDIWPFLVRIELIFHRCALRQQRTKRASENYLPFPNITESTGNPGMILGGIRVVSPRRTRA